MEVSKQERAYGRLLLSIMEESEAAIGVALMTRGEKAREEMVRWLEEYEPTTDEEILLKAIEIRRQNTP